MVDDSRLLQENIKRMNNLETLISNGVEGVDIHVIGAILPPAIKYSQLKIYNLNENKGQFCMAIVFPYTAHQPLNTSESRAHEDSKTYSELENLDMGPINVKAESLQSKLLSSESKPQDFAGLRIEGVFDLVDSNTLSASDVSQDGTIKEVSESLYIDESAQIMRKFLATEGFHEEGMLFESDVDRATALPDKDARIDLTDADIRFYMVKKGKRGPEFKKEGLSEYVSSLDITLNYLKRNMRVTSISAYLNGQGINLMDLLKDMRSWYQQTLM